MPFFTNQLYKIEKQQSSYAEEPGPHFGPKFKFSLFCGSVRFSQLWVFSVFISAFQFPSISQTGEPSSPHTGVPHLPLRVCGPFGDEIQINSYWWVCRRESMTETMWKCFGRRRLLLQVSNSGPKGICKPFQTVCRFFSASSPFLSKCLLVMATFRVAE